MVIVPMIASNAHPGTLRRYKTEKNAMSARKVIMQMTCPLLIIRLDLTDANRVHEDVTA
jgi:hypothetical protein